MSEDEARRDHDESQDEVDAHRHVKAGNEEATDDSKGENDEVEAHRHVKAKHAKY